MLKQYRSKSGRIYDLTAVSTSSPDKITEYTEYYRKLAEQTANEDNTDVFYCLKTFGKNQKGYFFTIPVSRDEVLDLNSKFGVEYYIGVLYKPNTSENTNADFKLLDERRLAMVGSEPTGLDDMSGKKFESLCADILHFNGYSDAKRTPVSGDHGIDIIAYKDGKRYAVQCKRYKGNVGFKAVQEVYTGKALFHADYGMIMTNSHFTKQAIDDAKRLNIDLWDRERLLDMIQKAKGIK